MFPLALADSVLLNFSLEHVHLPFPAMTAKEQRVGKMKQCANMCRFTEGAESLLKRPFSCVIWKQRTFSRKFLGM